MARWKRIRKLVRDWVAAVVGLTALAVGLLLYAREPRRQTFDYRMTAGSFQGRRHQIAKRLAAGTLPEVRIKLIQTSGSKEALELMGAKELDLALIQGGLGVGDREVIRQVVPLHVEPLHMLVKGELHEEVSRHLAALRGKTVNLSEVGSGTHELAMEVLKFAGLTPRLEDGSGNYTATTWSYERLEMERDRSKMPDAVFMVSSLPSPVAKALIARHGYRLVPLQFGEAFSLDALTGDGPSAEGGGATEVVERFQIVETVIPAYTYGVEPGVPAQPLTTIGTRLLLVAREDLDERAIERVLDAVFSTEFSQTARPPLDAKLLESSPEPGRHPGTNQYLTHHKPLVTGDVVDSLEKWASLTGAILGGLFFLWHWLRQRYRRTRDLGFESYMSKVTALERQALTFELGATLNLKELVHIQAEISRLKSEALEKFAEGELGGEELMSSFLTHVNDARNYIARLILHERDSLEDQALSQDRTPEALWYEALGGRTAPESDD